VNLTLKVWRQAGPSDKGSIVTYEASDISPDMSFLEMLDVVNSRLEREGKEPIAFDHDCREGICGMCSLAVNGVAHGPDDLTTVCQLHMRRFRDGDTIFIEPWRARAFPVLKDLVVDRSALDRIVQAGGFVSVNTGGVPDGNALPISKEEADLAMDAAACIGCGACVAACKNGSAMLFVAAKISHLAHLPQGQPERLARAEQMILAMDREGFGNCSNQRECEAVCPKGIKFATIAAMNGDYLRAARRRHPRGQSGAGGTG